MYSNCRVNTKHTHRHCILHLQHDKDESFAVLEDLRYRSPLSNRSSLDHVRFPECNTCRILDASLPLTYHARTKIWRYSTFGTFVNGVRCAGLTRLQNGVEVALNVDYR